MRRRAAVFGVRLADPRLVTLLYQTGYLTIKGFRQMGGMREYDLGFPNLEVESSFLTALEQIEKNNYAEKYDLAGKRVVRIGVSFSSEKRTIVDHESCVAPEIPADLFAGVNFFCIYDEPRFDIIVVGGTAHELRWLRQNRQRGNKR